MAKRQFILSTLTNDQEFRLYEAGAPGRAPAHSAAILIRGKAGLPNRHLWTPQGVVTEVTDEQLSKLRDNKVFQRLERNGWFTIANGDPRDADAMAADQAQGDGAKLMTAKELKAKGKKAAQPTDGAQDDGA